MTIRQHRTAIRLAEQTNDEIGKIVANLGTSDAPRGRLIAAYAAAIRALRGKLDNQRLVIETLNELRSSVEQASASAMVMAADAGRDLAERSLRIYGEDLVPVDVQPFRDSGHLAIMAQLDTQLSAFRNANLHNLVDENELLGDDSRAGWLTYGVVLKTAAVWLALVANNATKATIKRNVTRTYVKQAIAGIDERTTDCCLRVSGQVVRLNEKFDLTGTPRFADEMDRPPFHWYCRTTTALVLSEDAFDESTSEIVAAARDELTAREKTGKLVEIHPASAISRRR